ncbi:MAG: succinylglutamate desuccinylase/aspartoacylase family protein [Saprospiraceae bacterium]
MQNLLESCQPGQRSLVDLDVGELPSGTPIKIRAHVIRAEKPGPTVLLLGGVHGDEINGVEIVRRAVSSGLLRHLNCGSVIAIPLLNVYGFLNYSRDVPDGKDVNRSFPGTANGSLASRVANVITKQVLPLVDFGIDFHTGGWAHHNHPQIRYTPKDPKAEVLAKAFHAPVTLESTTIPRSLRRTALEMEKPMIIFEGGENLRLHGPSIESALQGIRNVLESHNMLSKNSDSRMEPALSEVERVRTQPDTIFLNKSAWTRAAKAGLFEWCVPSGNWVEEGQTLGYLRDPYGIHEEEVVSPRKAFIIGHDNSPVISQGDALFHLAWVE